MDLACQSVILEWETVGGVVAVRGIGSWRMRGGAGAARVSGPKSHLRFLWFGGSRGGMS